MKPTMKALVKTAPGVGLALEEVPLPRAGAGDLLIRVEKAAICGDDARIYVWDEWAQRNVHLPRIIGREFVGTVAALGDDVTGFSVGERVSGEAHVSCGVCRSCRAGRRHLCTNTVRIGIDCDGCFAEYMSLPATNAWHVGDSIPSRVAAIFDALGSATHAALSFDLVGEDVLITGAGPIGLMAIAVARHVGARNVVVTDVNPYRLELAEKMGATRTVDAHAQSIPEVVKELGMVGFDIGLETSGAATAFEAMLDSMYCGGRIVLVGIASMLSRIDSNHLVYRSTAAQIDWDQVVVRGLTIKGIYGRQVWETWYKMQTMLEGGLDIEPVITHELPVEDYKLGFVVVDSGQGGKVVLHVAQAQGGRD